MTDTTNRTEPSGDVYTRVTRHIVDELERQGGLPAGGFGPLPVNAHSGRHYRGINTLALWVAAARRGYDSPRWGTLRQWNELGVRVRKGERSTLVVFWKSLGGDEGERGEEPADAEASRPRFVARGYSVFNAAQVDGSGDERLPEEYSVPALERAEAFAVSLGADGRLRPEDEQDANGRLIAAAPELLDSLVELTHEIAREIPSERRADVVCRAHRPLATSPDFLRHGRLAYVPQTSQGRVLIGRER